ncbi:MULTISPECIES: serine/threonine protein kinase [unclassified Pseudomonas]|uniref:serine/threonine protein kinase n=1 Tax=unclassified Pseudomonas TaxID=196821 RepID=UPI001CBF7DCA|nr:MULTISPECIES: protein kinase [unclassified Pseudomonas]
MIDVRKLIGTVVQGWQLLEVLGAGADGIVYLGEKGSTKVAIKLFFPEVLEKYGVAGAEERLVLQLELIGGKHHPNLVEIFAGGMDAELKTLYLVMEYVSGQSLDKVVKILPPETIPLLLGQLAEGARFLESKGLYHRDIKPANIVVNEGFTKLTLLDLGIIYKAPEEQGGGRVSGDEFVATVRYSPPEFVWRDEVSSSNEAWRAITFYQIGATLHDMIMGKPLFSGMDSPRACLYDAVRDSSPEISSDECASWIVQLAKSCLIKDWRERGRIVSWDSFKAPDPIDDDLLQSRQAIRVRQIRNDELVSLKEGRHIVPLNSRLKRDIWDLQNKLFREIRQFLLGEQIFPKFSTSQVSISEMEYLLGFCFEVDTRLMFVDVIDVKVRLAPSNESELCFDLSIQATACGHQIYDAIWTENFTVESASRLALIALLQIADHVVPKE